MSQPLIKPSILILASALTVAATPGYSEIDGLSNEYLISGVKDPKRAAVD